jgi:hypothetical protein
MSWIETRVGGEFGQLGNGVVMYSLRCACSCDVIDYWVPVVLVFLSQVGSGSGEEEGRNAVDSLGIAKNRLHTRTVPIKPIRKVKRWMFSVFLGPAWVLRGPRRNAKVQRNLSEFWCCSFAVTLARPSVELLTFRSYALCDSYYFHDLVTR